MSQLLTFIYAKNYGAVRNQYNINLVGLPTFLQVIKKPADRLFSAFRGLFNICLEKHLDLSRRTLLHYIHILKARALEIITDTAADGQVYVIHANKITKQYEKLFEEVLK